MVHDCGDINVTSSNAWAAVAVIIYIIARDIIVQITQRSTREYEVCWSLSFEILARINLPRRADPSFGWMIPSFSFFEIISQSSLIHVGNGCIKNSDIILEIEPYFQVLLVQNETPEQDAYLENESTDCPSNS